MHEAYLRLVGQSALRVDSRAHFFGIAAGLMREILVDHARMRGAAKRGGNGLTLTLAEAVAVPKERELDLIAVDDTLNSLAALDPRQSRIVELRFFGGLPAGEERTTGRESCSRLCPDEVFGEAESTCRREFRAFGAGATSAS